MSADGIETRCGGGWLQPAARSTEPADNGDFPGRATAGLWFRSGGFLCSDLLRLYNQGVWLIDKVGAPIYTEFTCQWIAGLLALHGQAAEVYDPFEFLKMQITLVGPKALYGIRPYPLTYFLILMPFASLPYATAFLAWSLARLLACIAVVYFIVRRPAAIALVLASPFTAWNFVAGHNGFLTAAFFGAALLLLERRPVLAGFFIGCLTYKPHFGILFPVALASFRQWRAFGSAAVTAVLLPSASIGVLGSDTWEALPRQVVWFAGETLATGASADPAHHWGKLQTIYGLVRYLNGGGLWRGWRKVQQHAPPR